MEHVVTLGPNDATGRCERFHAHATARTIVVLDECCAPAVTWLRFVGRSLWSADCVPYTRDVQQTQEHVVFHTDGTLLLHQSDAHVLRHQRPVGRPVSLVDADISCHEIEVYFN